MAFDKLEWKPTNKQAQFLSIPLSIKEAFYGGGAGSAKTDVLIVYALVHKWHENPRFKQVLMRRTYADLKKETVQRTRELYTKFGATLNQTDMIWTFPREDQYGGQGLANAGATIFLGHCENENDVHNYDSMEINLFSPDEITLLTEFIYLYIGFTRVRTSDKTLPAIIRTAGMPGGPGHSFTKKRFVTPYPAGGKLIVGRGNNKRIYIHATLSDNPHIDPAYKQSLEALPEAEKRAKLHGDWDAYQGQVFEEFRDRQYPDEPDNALHVIEPFDTPAWWPKIVIIDWGFSAMNYVSYSAISPDRRVYTYREQGWLKTKIEEWAPAVIEFLEIDNPRIIRVCKSAGQDRGQEHTIQQQISKALGRNVELSNNNKGSRVAGKMLIHEYLRWREKPAIPVAEQLEYNDEYARWLFRNRGMNEYKSYLNSFTPLEKELNLPKWQIFNCCPLMVESIKSCSYDKPKHNKSAEDVAEFEGDDPYDNARYLLDYADSFFADAQNEFSKIQQQQFVINQLSNSGDFTAFYRNMRTVESSSGVKMISRFHRR